MPDNLPRKKPSQGRARELVARILDTTHDLYTHEGLAACNTNRIAREAGISVGSLYQYFPTKEAVFTEIWRNQELELAQAVRACPTGSLEAWLDALIMVFVEHKTFAHQQHGGDIIENAIQEGFNVFQAELPSRLAPNIAADMRAIIVALLQRETQSLTGWKYTLAQRTRRTLGGYLALR